MFARILRTCFGRRGARKIGLRFLVAVMVVGPGSSSASRRIPAKANGLIVFASGSTFGISGPHAVSQIWVVKPDGSGLRRLTHSRANNAFPAWSPDGKKIAFFRDFGFSDPTKSYLYVMNADGSGQRRLTSTVFDGEPAWSPDGRKIAYHDDVFIDTINADGTGRRHLTTKERDRSDPTWSPNGRKIAYIYANGDLNPIYTMNPDGSDERLLASNPDIAANLAWSPDGKKIAFLGPPRTSSNVEAIYTINADGSDEQRLTKGEPVWGFGLGLAWSPDARKIVFPGVAPGGVVDIYVMNADGTHIRRVTHTQQVGMGVSWQPLTHPAH
jgi:Tol biopolymer transport system component